MEIGLVEFVTLGAKIDAQGTVSKASYDKAGFVFVPLASKNGVCTF